MSMLTQRSPKRSYGTGKRLVEHDNNHSQRFQSNVKRTKFDGAISMLNGREISKGAKVDSSVAEPAKPSRILPPNNVRREAKPLVSGAKADALKQNMTEKNVKKAGKEDMSKHLATSVTSQDSDKGKNISQHTRLANGHLSSELGKRVSVAKELRRGCIALENLKSVVFIDGSSQVEPKSSIRMVETHDKLIKDDIPACSLTGRKLEKNAYCKKMVQDQNKHAKFTRNETCTVATKKFSLMVLSKRNVESKVDSRSKVLKAIELFEEQYTRLLQERKIERTEQREKRKITHRIDVKAAMVLKKEGKWVNTVQEVGEVPGVNIGDQFQYRAELTVVGLHSRFSAGIDYIKVGEKRYATCIVDSGRYKNKRISPDSFIYIGEGGNPEITRKKAEDQKPKCGNLALITSMKANLPVRVVHCCQTLKEPNTLGVNNGSGFRYTYQGLYTVSSYQRRKDESGKWVFKFEMKRLTDQSILVPQLPSDASKSTVEE